MGKKFTKRILKIIFIDFIIYGILYFPIWWYSRGLFKVLLKSQKILSDAWENLGLSIQIKYLFKPMYAQRDLAGILISFFMRLLMLIYKSICMIFVLLWSAVLFLLWAFLPIIVIYGIIVNYNFLKTQ
ncbi:MAG TPA: hypothetical protein PLD95_02675 [bacterium]|jgi:hypothetical protein|nr:hypothetical protein [bacterium]HOG38355.1 hypothetical protein [bacterium]HQI03257.1 hypothetical protein [bacterium]